MSSILNVKKYGAVGDGVADDWAAIMAATSWTSSPNRGTIYFPPGTYFVSKPIDFSPKLDLVGQPDINGIIFRGELGASMIVGNFSDYVLKRAANDTAGVSGGHQIENLTIINNHATGGGIRLGYCVGAAIRNCVVTANLGINTASADNLASTTSLEVVIENCTLSPGSNVAGSIGVMSVADGPIRNCSIVGFATGMVLWGQEGAQNVLGCYFERNTVALAPGITPTLASNSNAQYNVSGCWFKNNGTAILNPVGTARYSGIRIEGANGTLPGGTNPQYGIRAQAGRMGALCQGIIVTGQYDIAGIAIDGGEAFRLHTMLLGVQCSNSSTTPGAKAWSLAPTAGTIEQYMGCNVAPVFTVANLPAVPTPILSIAWAGGTTTLTVGINVNPLMGSDLTITVTGVSPSGYNGTFAATVATFNTITYAQANPGSPTGSGGTVVLNANSNAIEGDCYNVSDSPSATWGAIVNSGGGGNHDKVRWNGSNWAVMGK